MMMRRIINPLEAFICILGMMTTALGTGTVTLTWAQTMIETCTVSTVMNEYFVFQEDCRMDI